MKVVEHERGALGGKDESNISKKFVNWALVICLPFLMCSPFFIVILLSPSIEHLYFPKVYTDRELKILLIKAKDRNLQLSKQPLF